MRPAYGDDTAIACCVSAMRGRQADAVLRRPGQPGQGPALRDQRRPRRDDRRAGRARASRRSTGDVPGLRRAVARRSTRMLDWLAETYVNALNVIHYMHDKYAYERIEMALHDHPVHAPWPAASPACRSPRTACPRSSTPGSRSSATRPAWPSTTQIEGDFPAYGNNDDRADAHRRRRWSSRFMAQGPRAPDLPRRRAHPVGADHHLERRLRQEHRQHPRRPPRRRTVRPGRQPDERPRPARHASPPRCRWPSCPTSDAADGISLTSTITPDGLGRTREERVEQPGRRPRRLHRRAAAST